MTESTLTPLAIMRRSEELDDLVVAVAHALSVKYNPTVMVKLLRHAKALKARLEEDKP